MRVRVVDNASLVRGFAVSLFRWFAASPLGHFDQEINLTD